MNSERKAVVLTPEQSRAARGWLNISQQELADSSLVHKRTIADFERGATVPYDRTLRDIRRALEERGVEFLVDGIRVAEAGSAGPDR